MKDLTVEEEIIPNHASLALEAVLLFHSGSPWDESKKRRWVYICESVLGPIENRPPNGFHYKNGPIPASNEATTKVLCDIVRKSLGR